MASAHVMAGTASAAPSAGICDARNRLSGPNAKVVSSASLPAKLSSSLKPLGLTKSRDYISVKAAQLARAAARPADSWQPARAAELSVRCAATVAEAEVAAPIVEKFEYQAETSRLMDLIVHSLYSNKEVFLRELISNASDALDKMRFLGVTDPALMEGEQDLVIRIKTDPAAGTITLTDTGIGMTRQELVESLGTIAQSGTAKFVQALKDKQDGAAPDSNLIGQFGVGFYSAFLVADKVTVTTKSAGSDKQFVWEAEADSSSYTISEEVDESKKLARGTSITLHLKDEAKSEFSADTKISDLVKTYSQFISFPIYVWQQQSRDKEEEYEEPGKDGEAPEKKTRKVQEKYFDWKLVNDTKPIWMRTPKEVTKEEYATFFKNTYKEFMDPMAYSHFNTEGEIEFRSLLFVPGMLPFGQEQNLLEKSRNIRLYVKRVFISDEFDGELLPRFLSFVKGVVDSSDLPLNVSREILQESRVVRIMRKRLVRKIFDMIEEIAGREEKEDYQTFWSNFGRNLRYGVLEDSSSHGRIAPLLRFFSSKSEKELTSLDAYVSRMKESQKAIYYLAAESISSAKSAPFLEQLAKRDLEVLFLTEAIDEPVVGQLQSYKEKKFVDVSKEDLDLGDEAEKDKEKEEALEKEYTALCDWIKQQLGDKVAKVQVSRRLASSPCVLVAGKFGWSANMEKIMRAQMRDTSEMEYMRARRILEINPDHPIIKDLKEQSVGSPESLRAKQMVELMHQTALLASGFTPENPSEFGSKIYEMMALAISAQEGDNPVAAAPSVTSTGEVVEATEMREETDPWKQ